MRSLANVCLFRAAALLALCLLSNLTSWSLLLKPTVFLRYFCVAYGAMQLHVSVDVQKKNSATNAGAVSGRSVKGWKISSFVKGFLFFLLSILSFHVIAVLYGAPLQEDTEETFSWALLMATLTALPCWCMLGSRLETWVAVVLNRPESEVESFLQMTVLCTVVGAWLGAFPIPLDWDRPWQVWPIPCSIGALLGHTGGLVLSAIQFKRHKLDSKSKMV
ncbi:PIGF [Branchiostoma lanceolatum]|uniref:PIGF protein n=1 Tax=Branchiostoma lanceolatum TaxID=7740 RepID=A0A8J9ZTL2_BRALA|nr:PIGF [Branchiostoma lanceolatum]